MTFGVRPEHITLSSENGIPAQVQVVEHLGGESYLHVQISNGETMVVRVDGETQVIPEQAVRLQLNAGHVHLFDRQGDAMERLP